MSCPSRRGFFKEEVMISNRRGKISARLHNYRLVASMFALLCPMFIGLEFRVAKTSASRAPLAAGRGGSEIFKTTDPLQPLFVPPVSKVTKPSGEQLWRTDKGLDFV